MPRFQAPSVRRHRMVPRSLCAAALVLVVVVSTAQPAAAHTELVSSTPAPGATVDALRSIELRFSKAIEVSATHLWIADSAGYLELSPATPIGDDDASLSVPVPPLGDGTYAVTWHVLAVDGAPAQGTFTVTIAAAASPASPPTTPAAPAAGLPPDTSLAIPLAEGPVRSRVPSLPEHAHALGGLSATIARGLLDASLSTLIGGLAFVVAVWPQGARLARTRQVLWVAAGFAAIASFELAAFQHAAASGLSTMQALSPWHQWDALQFRFGRVAAARGVLLGGSALLTARLARNGSRTSQSLLWCAATVVVSLGLVETLVLLGHATASGPLATTARVLHVLGVSIWIGGLVMLLCVVVPRRRSEELVAVLPRFSTLATVAVGILTVGGVLLAVDLVGSAAALPSTAYGRVLLAKVSAVGVLLLAASRIRRQVRAWLDAPHTPGATSVVRPVAVWVSTEVGLVAVVLGLTALLVTRLPPG